MEIILFTLAAVFLYFFADWLLRELERRHGAPFKNRGVIYFIIILILALGSFEVLQRILLQSPTG